MLALYPQTTCFYRALIHTPPQRVRSGNRKAFSGTGNLRTGLHLHSEHLPLLSGLSFIS